MIKFLAPPLLLIIYICFRHVSDLNIASYQVFVGARLHVTGGALRGGRGVDGEAAIAGKFWDHFWSLA